MGSGATPVAGGVDPLPRAARRLRGLPRDRALDVFCLNDSPDLRRPTGGRGQLLTRFLERYYPLVSSFELDARDDQADATLEPGDAAAYA